MLRSNIMTRRLMTDLFVALWALLALPALCTAGVIGHSCDCDHSTECAHEAECPSDPCSQLKVGRPQGSREPATVAAFHSVAWAGSILDVQGNSPLEIRDRSYEPVGRKNLPYPPCDLPLRI